MILLEVLTQNEKVYNIYLVVIVDVLPATVL